MLPKEINAFIVEKLRGHLAFFVLMILLLIGGFFLKQASVVKVSEYKHQVSELQSQHVTLTMKADKYEKDLKYWNSNLSNIYKERTGLKLDLARKLIDDLKFTYNIRDISVNLTSPQVRDNFGELQHINLQYSTVSIAFQAYTDIDVVRFLNALAQQLPGIVRFSSLNITAISAITEQIIDTTDPLKPRIKTIVSAKSELVWHDFADKSKTEK